jgi:membrane-bound metal-dependent hydrolase YbcI (DUF457 family)
MFIGHFAVGFGAKRFAPQVSLGTLFLACQLADIVWPVLVLAGIETFEIQPGITAVTPLDFTSYPYSHSLVALAIWATAFALAYKALRRAPWSAAIVLAIVVLSHWALDVATHRPDVPVLLHGGPLLGLGLWNSVPATMIVETVLFAAGIAMYARITRPRDRIGAIALWTLVGFLFAMYLAAILGPPPPSVAAVAWSDMGQWLLVGWAYWVDRHRERTA